VIVINGERCRTISDAAGHWGVSVKTVREWIKKGAIPEPPRKTHGLREMDIYPDEYMKEATKRLKEYRKKRKKKK